MYSVLSSSLINIITIFTTVTGLHLNTVKVKIMYIARGESGGNGVLNETILALVRQTNTYNTVTSGDNR